MKSDNFGAKYSLPTTNNIRKLLALESDPTVSAIIRLAWQAGLTATEITSLKWSDVSIKEGTLFVSGRIVPVCDELLSFLSGLKQEGPYAIYSRRTNGGHYSQQRVSQSTPCIGLRGRDGHHIVRLAIQLYHSTASRAAC